MISESIKTTRVLGSKPVTVDDSVLVSHYNWGAGRPAPDSGPGPDLPVVGISPQHTQKYTGVYAELIRSLLATSYASLTIIGASDVGIWSGAGPVHQMDISSNTLKIHGRIRGANPVTIGHFLDVSHYYWGIGRPEWVSGQYPPPRLAYRPDGNSIST